MTWDEYYAYATLKMVRVSPILTDPESLFNQMDIDKDLIVTLPECLAHQALYIAKNSKTIVPLSSLKKLK